MAHRPEQALLEPGWRALHAATGDGLLLRLLTLPGASLFVPLFGGSGGNHLQVLGMEPGRA